MGISEANLVNQIDQERDAMVREIMRDETFLAQKAEPATQDDLDTALIIQHEIDHCKRIIV